jgi:hypothetical protein
MYVRNPELFPGYITDKKNKTYCSSVVPGNMAVVLEAVADVFVLHHHPVQVL